jgi:hypothetical protein
LELYLQLIFRVKVWHLVRYPPGKEHSYIKPQSKSASIPCRPKLELDYITYVVANWQVGVKVRNLDAGYDRDELVQFTFINMHLRRFVRQGQRNYAQLSNGLLRIEKERWFLEELLFAANLSSRQLTHGIGGMATWVRRGHGPLVKPSIGTSVRNMSRCI